MVNVVEPCGPKDAQEIRSLEKPKSMVKFAYTILYVQDVNRSVTFYETAFGFTRKFISPDNDYGELLAGETTLSFASISLAGSNLHDGFMESSLTNKPFGIEIGFTAHNVEETLDNSIAAVATLVE